ncbi:MAG TPA: cytochrome C oxidase subunit IV family protein [Gemmatimonadales bacterium]
MDPRAVHKERTHPTAGLYLRVAVVLFVLTALEVYAFEVSRRGSPAGLAAIVSPLIIPILVVLSAAKFALVAMFYMHLKQDATIFSGLFVLPLIIAIVLVMALIMLFSVVHLMP